MQLTSKLSFAAVALALALPAAASAAGSNSASVSVSTSVAANCTISSATLTFPAYDPLVTNATADDTVSNTISYACTKGTSPTIGLNAGGNSASATGTTRAMSNGAGTPSFLSYEIYKDSAMTQVWGNATTGLNSPGAAPSKAPQTVTMFGKIPGGQDVPNAASYSDTVTATINF